MAYTGNKNFAFGSLSAQLEIAGTSLTLQAGEGSKFHATLASICVIWSASYDHPSQDANREIVKITLTAGDSFTVTRAQEDTIARLWVINSKIANVATVARFSEFETGINTNTTAIANIVSGTTKVGDADKLDGYNSALTSSATNLVPVTESSGKLSLTFIPSGILLSNSFAIFEHQETSGTSGGTSSSSGTNWYTRTLNTTVYNGITGCSRSSNQITLPAGTFFINAKSLHYYADYTKIKIRNITNSTDVAFSLNAFLYYLSAVQGLVELQTITTIAASKTFELQYRTTYAYATNGLGLACSFGTEVYANLTIVQLA